MPTNNAFTTLGYPAGISQTNVTSESAFPSGQGGTTRGLVQVTAYNQWDPTSAAYTSLGASIIDGHPFKVKGCFKATAGASLNTTFKLYWNVGANTNLTTFTNDVLLVSSGTLASGGAASLSSYLEAVCLWDSTSQQLMAVQGLAINNIPTTPTVLNSGAYTITATNPIKTAQTLSNNLQFFASALIGTSNAANVATLVELSLELV
jgi:hypothetical protein